MQEKTASSKELKDTIASEVEELMCYVDVDATCHLLMKNTRTNNRKVLQ
jgi:hypothetical protein